MEEEGNKPISGKKKHEWRLLGARGRRNKRGSKGKKKQARKKKRFFLKYINFYFLNERYFGYFIELLDAQGCT